MGRLLTPGVALRPGMLSTIMRRFRRGVLQAAFRLRDALVAKLYFYAHVSHSQEGEDMVLRRVFHEQSTGFYIDIGAHHPERYSNTAYFYRRGWSGVNIDATPGMKQVFDLLRPRDINVEAAIGREEADRLFYQFNEPSLNSFDAVLAERWNRYKDYRIVSEIPIRTTPLSQILDRYISRHRHIDFMSVDIEGLDLEALQSNDWQLYRPEFVLVECIDVPFEETIHTPLYTFMAAQQYGLFAKTFSTVVFRTCAA